MTHFTLEEMIRSRQLRGLAFYGVDPVSYRETCISGADYTIEKMIEQYSKETGETPPPEFIERVRSELRNPNLPTDLQDPVSHQMYSELLGESLSVAKKLGLWRNDDPVIATEMGGDVNGCCFQDQNGSKAILLDGTMQTFCHLFAKIICLASCRRTKDGYSFSLEPGQFEQRVCADDTLQRLRELLVAYVEKGTTNGATPYELDYWYSSFIEPIRDGMKLFVVAHECGHIFHKHLDDPVMTSGNDEAALSRKIENDTQAYLYRHRKEVEADGFGLSIVLNSIQRKDQTSLLRLMGPFLFFNGLQLLENMIFFYFTGESPWERADKILAQLSMQYAKPSTHPHPFTRFHLLRKSLEQADSIPPDFKRVAEYAWGDVQQGLVAAELKICESLKSTRLDRRIHPRWERTEGQFSTIDKLAEEFSEQMATLSQELTT